MTDAATDRSTHDARASASDDADAASAAPQGTQPAPDAQALREMMHKDYASALLGLVVESADEPGRAVVSMLVREDMANGFGITHGGFVFTLADTAFALACNEDERVTVAAGADIAFLKSTFPGQTLTATAVRRALVGRTGLYDVTIVDEQATRSRSSAAAPSPPTVPSRPDCSPEPVEFPELVEGTRPPPASTGSASGTPGDEDVDDHHRTPHRDRHRDEADRLGHRARDPRRARPPKSA